MSCKNFKDFESKCITCIRVDIIEENEKKKAQCDRWWSTLRLNDWCDNYIKDKFAFNTQRIYDLLWGDFILEEDFK